MKKKKILSGVAVGAAMAGVMLSGCAGCANLVQDLYGPPPDEESGYSRQLTEEDLPSNAETLYGPPADLETEAPTEAVPSKDETDGARKEETDESETASDESSSYAVPLYGPPPAEE